jgi:hypothetical protein
MNSAREIFHSQIFQMIVVLQGFLKSSIPYESCSVFSTHLDISEQDGKVQPEWKSLRVKIEQIRLKMRK